MIVIMRQVFIRIHQYKQTVIEFLKRPLTSEEGATIAEYALLLALVVIALIGVLTNLSDALKGKIETIINQINSSR
jgi:Flp pilus assembly pilin Flp